MYYVSLKQFEGPLDLLLHLISKNKVSIYDIPIAEILEQYMAVLREAETMDMDVAGDFIAMAAQLVYIKSRMLLPQREETPGEDDPRAELVDMLLEYQRFRQATAFFREKGEEGADMLTKAPEPLGDAPREVHGVPNDLIRAANRLLRRVSRRIPPPAAVFSGIVGREPYPVTKKAAQILSRLLKAGVTKFRSLFSGSRTRSEIVATFMAVLELCRLSSVRVDANERGEMAVTYLKMPEESALPQQEE